MVYWIPPNVPGSVILTKNDTLGSYTQSETVTAKTARSVNTFEVLDYDSHGDYALIFKSICIKHSQTQICARANTPYTGPVYIQYLYSNGSLPASALVLANTHDDFMSQGERTVTYKLHYKIGDKPFTVDLATCTIASDMNTYTVVGQRIYGVSIQVIPGKFISYSYELHDACYATPRAGLGDAYDSPRNIEDWNVNQLNEAMWTRSKQVVGLININDGLGSEVGYRKHEEYDILTVVPSVIPPNQYGVGVIGVAGTLSTTPGVATVSDIPDDTVPPGELSYPAGTIPRPPSVPGDQPAYVFTFTGGGGTIMGYNWKDAEGNIGKISYYQSAIFDADSFSPGGLLILDYNTTGCAAVRSMDFTGATNHPTLIFTEYAYNTNGDGYGGLMIMGGDLTLIADMTISATSFENTQRYGYLRPPFDADEHGHGIIASGVFRWGIWMEGGTITSAGHHLQHVEGAGKLGDDLDCDIFAPSVGFDFNGHTLTTKTWVHLSYGISVNYPNHNYIDATLNISDAFSIEGTNGFDRTVDLSNAIFNLEAGVNATIGMRGGISVGGGQLTLIGGQINSPLMGSVYAQNTTLVNCVAGGGGTFTAGSGCIDGGGNTGWIFM